MATIKSGRRGYDTRLNRIEPNVVPNIIFTDRNLQESNFLTFLMRTKTRTTKGEVIEWDVDDWMPTSDLTNGTATATAVTIPVTNPLRFNRGKVVRVKRTGEHMKVTAVNQASSNITVMRGLGALNSGTGTAGAALVSGDTLTILGPAMGENNRRQDTQTTVPTGVTAWTQQMRWELEMSRRQMKRTFVDGGTEWDYQLKKTMDQARKDMNGIFLAQEGNAYVDEDEGYTTLTYGMRPVITTNVLNAAGTLYQTPFNEWLFNSGMRKGPRNKVLVCSSAVLLALTEMFNDLAHFQVEMGDRKVSMGVNVMMYYAPNGGELMLVEDRFLTDNFDGEALLVAFGDKNFARAIFSGNGITDEIGIESDTEDPDDMGSTATIIGDTGLQWGDEAVHGRITGVTGGAKGRSVM